MKDEALRLALEALEAATRYGAGGFEDAKDALREAQAAQPSPVPLTDEQAEFESVFKLPSNCTKFQGGYAPTSHNAWEAQTFCARWEGWKARSTHGITKGQP
jgi:hypothetical protein